MENIEKYSDHDVATQRNDLIHGKQSLSLVQKRIFALAVQKIKKGDEDFKTYTIEISDLVQAGTSRNIFTRIENETENLMRKILLKKEKIEGTELPKTTRWNMVSKAVHNPGTGELNINLHPDIRDMLLDLKGKFTSVPVAEILACRSSYGQRLYEMLYSQRWKGNVWDVSVKDLRFSLNAEDKYPNFSHFRQYILKKAQEDLSDHTNMLFTWREEARGKGRKITHIVFEFSIKENQLSLGIEPPKFEPQFNLASRLKEYAELNKTEVSKIIQWLAENKDQQQPLAYWLNERVECPDPVDALGRSIQDMQAWAYDKIKKAMKDGGFPKPKEYNPRGYN